MKFNKIEKKSSIIFSDILLNGLEFYVYTVLVDITQLIIANRVFQIGRYYERDT